MSTGSSSGAPRGALVVTGASRGIGAACAVLAAARGWPVAILYQQRASQAQQVVSRIEAEGGHAVAIAADVACGRQVAAAFDQITDRLGVIGALINNAGITGGASPVSELREDQLELIPAKTET